MGLFFIIAPEAVWESLIPPPHTHKGIYREIVTHIHLLQPCGAFGRFQERRAPAAVHCGEAVTLRSGASARFVAGWLSSSVVSAGFCSDNKKNINVASSVFPRWRALAGRSSLQGLGLWVKDSSVGGVLVTFNFRRLNAVVKMFFFCLFFTRKQTLMWLQGDSYIAQKGKLEDKAVPRLITSMDELSLNSRSSISNHLQEVRITPRVSQQMFQLMWIHLSCCCINELEDNKLTYVNVWSKTKPLSLEG